MDGLMDRWMDGGMDGLLGIAFQHTNGCWDSLYTIISSTYYDDNIYTSFHLQQSTQNSHVWKL